MRYAMLLGVLAALWGSLGAAVSAEPLPAPKGPVLLTVSGKIGQTNVAGQAQFDREMLEALGQASYTTSSQVSTTPQLFEGVPLRKVLERVEAQGRIMKASALNDYQIPIPLEDLAFEPILAMKVDGKVIAARDKGPLWIVYPRDQYPVLQDVRYDSRWVWQLNRLQID